MLTHYAHQVGCNGGLPFSSIVSSFGGSTNMNINLVLCITVYLYPVSTATVQLRAAVLSKRDRLMVHLSVLVLASVNFSNLVFA